MQDYRLVIPAALMWLVARWNPDRPERVIIVGIIAVTGAIIIRQVVDNSGTRLALVVGAALCAIGASTLIHQHLAINDPVTKAAHGSYVAITGTVTSHSRPDAGGTPRATVNVDRINAYGITRTSSQTITILAAGLHPGDHIHAAGILKEPAPFERAAGTLTGKVITQKPATGLRAHTNAIHTKLTDKANEFPAYAAGLIPGVAVGDDSRLPAETEENMRMLGLSHLTAVSGAHVSLTIGIIMATVGQRIPALTGALAVIGIGVLIMLVGPEPSVLRASAMGILVSLAIMIRRPSVALPLLALTIATASLAEPQLARSLGFTLSTVATAAIVVAGYPIRQRLSHIVPAGLAEAIAIPLVAGLASGVVLLSLGQASSVWTVAANAVVAPVVAPLTISGLLGGALLPLDETPFGLITAPLTAMALAVARASAWWIDSVTGISEWPGSGVHQLTALAANSLLLLGLLWVSRKAPTQWRWQVPPRALLLIATALALLFAFRLAPTSFNRSSIPADWEVIQCDVGQGAGFLARNGVETILIDVGEDPEPIRHCLKQAGVDHVDLLILTHFDGDHVRGLGGVLTTVSVAQVWLSENRHPDYGSRWVSDTLAEFGIPSRPVSAGAEFSTWVTVLSPTRPRLTEAETNADSLVVFLETSSGLRVLNLADVPANVQARLPGAPPFTSRASKFPGSDSPSLVDIVVIAHHGSADQSRRLAEHLKAPITLMSVGENDYGHPTPQAREIWDAPLQLTTQECGSIAITAAEVVSQCAGS